MRNLTGTRVSLEYSTQWYRPLIQVSRTNHMFEWSSCGSDGSDLSPVDIVLRFYPHFSTFSTHVTARAFSFPRHPVHPACASKSRDLSSLTLHSRALSFLPTFSFGSSRQCRGFLLRFSDSFVYDSLVPFSTIHLPHSAHFLIPMDVTGTSHFTFIRSPMLLSLIQYYT